MPAIALEASFVDATPREPNYDGMSGPRLNEEDPDVRPPEGPVEVPTIVVRRQIGPLTAVPPYLLTWVTLGLWPTITTTGAGVQVTILLPGREAVVHRWRREEDLFSWLPVLPLTPFWLIWRATPWGDPDPEEHVIEDLPNLVRAALAER